MSRATQLSVTLENKPGQLAKLTGALGRAKVNIQAITAVETTDSAVVRLVADSATKASTALTKAGLKPTRQAVLALELANEPGSLAAVTDKLAKAKVNINYAYGSAGKSPAGSVVVLSVDDLDKALKAL